MCNLGDGSTDVTFWKDIWAGDVLAQKFPRLFSFARDENVSIRHLMHAEDLDTLFSLPMSPEVFEELIQLQMILSSIAYDLNENDQWILDWGNQVYSFRQYIKWSSKTTKLLPFSRNSGSVSALPASKSSCGCS